LHADGYVRCAEDLHVSGSCHVAGAAQAKDMRISGSFHVGEDLIVENGAHVSGAMTCGGKVRCVTLSCSGGVSVKGDMEGEDVRVSGKLDCGGLLNAEKIDLYSAGHIGSIGGSEIKIHDDEWKKHNKITRMPLLSSLVGGGGRNRMKVDELIEGDIVALEYVTVPKVVGRVVAIGEGCEIDLVQYSEAIEIHPKAKVGKQERI
jgi:cytoskeletal protein CcmA (bactofilin family)